MSHNSAYPLIRAPQFSDRIESGPTWTDVARFLRAYRWMMVGVFLATVVSAYISVSFMSEWYSADADLLVKLGRENLDPPATSRNIPLTTGLRKEELTSEMAILQSPGIAAQVVDDLGVEAFQAHRVRPNDLIGRVKFEVKAIARAVKEQYDEALIRLDLRKRLDARQKAIAAITDNLTVEPKKESDVVSLQLRMTDRVLAMKVTQRLIDVYLVRRIAVRENDGVKTFLDGGAQQRHAELVRAEELKMNWKRSRRIVSPPEQRAILLRQISELEAEHSATLRQAEALRREVEASKRIIAGLPEYQRSATQEDPNPIQQSLKERLIARQSERLQLLAKYKPNSITITQIDEEIAELRGLLAKEPDTQEGTVTSQLNATRQSLQQKLQQDTIRLEGLQATAALQPAQIANLQGQLATIEGAQAKLDDMERKQQIAEQDYLAISKRKLDADVAAELDKKAVSNVSLISPPTADVEPIYPRKMILMAVALVIGLALSLALPLLVHYLKDSISDARDAESRTSLPCFGTVTLEDPV